MPDPTPSQPNSSQSFFSHKETAVLIISTFIAGLCSIIYELLISTASSYFLGDSIRQFSITIGLYMAAMGIGSYLSRRINTKLLSKFIILEIILGFLGGMSIPILYFAYAYTHAYYFVMVSLILSIGILIGLEIPLLTRIMEKYYALKFNISNILSVDYLGALMATLIFPFILLPLLGTFRSSLFFGLVNMGIGVLNLWCFADQLQTQKRRVYQGALFAVCSILCAFFVLAHVFLQHWSNNLYEDQIIFSRQSKFQKIVLTRNKQDVRLFLNGNLQLSSLDEYRYHEPLVHIPLGLVPHKEHILILGGGDGLVAREVLKYPDVKKISLVDLDPEVVKIAKKDHNLKAMNKGSLDDPRVEIIHEDAFVFLGKSRQLFDVIIADLPDPNNASLARLYSREFYKLVRSRLAQAGIFVTQATSPFFSKQTFWCINHTMKTAGFAQVVPYHANVPSFGDWGFMLAAHRRMPIHAIEIDVATKYLNSETVPALFSFAKDTGMIETEYSTLDNPVVLTYYLQGWKYWH